MCECVLYYSRMVWSPFAFAFGWGNAKYWNEVWKRRTRALMCAHFCAWTAPSSQAVQHEHEYIMLTHMHAYITYIRRAQRPNLTFSLCFVKQMCVIFHMHNAHTLLCSSISYNKHGSFVWESCSLSSSSRVGGNGTNTWHCFTRSQRMRIHANLIWKQIMRCCCSTTSS